MDVLCAADEREVSRGIVAERASHRAFLGISALLFFCSVACTTTLCASMRALGGMPMPGGWSASMTWMRMPGQSWLGAAVSFIAMWVAMMGAMMLPSLVPALQRYRQVAGMTSEAPLGPLTAVVGAGYFFVWTALGMAAYPLGIALTSVEMRQPALARAVPLGAGVIVLIAGALQFTAWKAHHLACCRESAGGNHDSPADAGRAWRHGVHLGLHCSYASAGLTAILLVTGVMDLRVMAVVTGAITIERVAPVEMRAARAIGAVIVGGGLVLIARAAGLG